MKTFKKLYVWDIRATDAINGKPISVSTTLHAANISEAIAKARDVLGRDIVIMSASTDGRFVEITERVCLDPDRPF